MQKKQKAHCKTLFSDKKDFSKYKTFSGSLSSTIASKVVTEITRKERELSFHPHFAYEEFTSLITKYC